MVHGAWNTSLFDQGINLDEESAVVVVELVQGIMPIEEQVVVVIHGWDILDIVVYLRDFKHGLELEIQGNGWNCRRKFFFLGRFGLACRGAHWLTRCLSLFVFLRCDRC